MPRITTSENDDPVVPKTRQDQALAIILGWLESGAFPPESRLPPLTVMAQRMGLKPMPVRGAVQKLVAAGRLRTVNGVGVFVVPAGGVARRVMVLAQAPGSLESSGHFTVVQLHEGLCQAMQSQGMTPIFCFRDQFPAGAAAIEERMQADRCDGVILLDVPAALGFELALRLGAHRVLSADYSITPSFLNEVRMAVRPGMTALLEAAYGLGHRHVGFLYDPGMATQWSQQERFQTFLLFTQDRGLSIQPGDLVETPNVAIEAYRAARAMLRRTPRVTAIMAATDLRAEAVLHAVADEGLTVGRDVSVLGFDDRPGTEALQLATVRVPRRELGVAAVELIERAFAEKLTGQRVSLPTTAVLRASLGPCLPAAS